MGFAFRLLPFSKGQWVEYVHVTKLGEKKKKGSAHYKYKDLFEKISPDMTNDHCAGAGVCMSGFMGSWC
jgi:hypothetical protein